MTPDFDQSIDRAGSHALKFDGRRQKFGSGDVLPLWVADMDFAVPTCVSDAVLARARHPIYGYTQYPESLYQSLIAWCDRRHRWQVEREWLVPASGVLASMSAAIQSCTAMGDPIVVQSPVYPGFFRAVEDCGRRLLHNPLRETDGRYAMDLAQLEQYARDGARALLLCNPHNPVGRAWTPGELEEVLGIARRHGLTVISDEVHGDLALPGASHHPLLGLARAGDRVIAVLSPGKTFNLQGLGLTLIAAPRADQRDALRNAIAASHLGDANPFAVAAGEAAWRDGDQWLDALRTYLAGTRDFVADRLRTHIPAIRLVPSEAGYLLWLDCRALGMDDVALREFFIHRCRLGLNPGVDFGPGGSGFMRMNIGTPRRNIEAALAAIERAQSQTYAPPNVRDIPSR
ncbi:PatB family C-S lyase [Rhodanobacter sp. DHG33]|uniref:MalY/PatB family protein n=1 Tax=Rhodanobacter sp. DHG33 TaxID=2775921 RepID=UPI00177DEAAD|nr:PatB family C-S lyase [Rhodanobacter sp. DHG33]MBD8900327.1 putative C-S lyase [Rhodanobacter sp. DHG33]